METQRTYSKKLESAKKKVKELKGFYSHLKTYIIVNLILLVLRGNVLHLITSNNEGRATSFLNWLDWNFLSTPILWGIGLMLHGIYVHRHSFTFLKKWEARQIQKYMDKDISESEKYK